MGKTSEGQIPLLDVSQFESGGKAGFSDWEIDCLETESSITRLGFNVYWVKKPNGKKFEYWRYSYRAGLKVKHKHVGSFERMQELQELPGWKIAALLGLP